MVKICVPVCVDRFDKMQEAVKRASQFADVIELRLDYLSESELARFNDQIRTAIKSTERPVILTLRPAEYGGRRAISAQDRLFFRIQNPSLVRDKKPEDYWDIELDL